MDMWDFSLGGGNPYDIEDFSEFDPLSLDWVQFSWKNEKYSVAIGELPGRRYREVWRNLNRDLGDLQKEGITHVYCMCSNEDLLKYRVPNLIQEYARLGFAVHHYPIKDDEVPEINELISVLNDIRDFIESGEKVYIHCFAGVGISCVAVICLLMHCDESLSPLEAIHSVRMLRGPRAVQTVKQFNFITGFKDFQNAQLSSQQVRRLSR
ncbi:Cyclin-dependent kinase inhibitor 3 [Blattella germanica]|nr:Cyclin-dependent kinase inhibitor 3 [Blattella germanica]